MVAFIARTGAEVDAIDVFSGFGGTSQGIRAAGARLVAAANHNAVALECHAANFPDVEHLQADLVDEVEPQVIDRKGRRVAGRWLDPAELPRARFAWFSPSCAHHSIANAKRLYAHGPQQSLFGDEDAEEVAYASSERSRVSMCAVLRYAARHAPETLVVENVVEVAKWGPAGDGSTFRWWLSELDKLGYCFKLCYLNSMFFAPCPQSRDRVYIVAWHKGNTAPDLDYRPTAYCASERCGGKIVAAVQTWKRPTAAWPVTPWGKYLHQYDYRCPDCGAVVHPASWMAASAIDWSDLGPTLGERIAAGKHLAPNTLARIRRAIEKYRHAPPVILPGHIVGASEVAVCHGPEARSKAICDPLSTLTGKRNAAVAVTGATVPLRSGRPRADALGEALPTVVADGSRLYLETVPVVANNNAIDGRRRAARGAETLGTRSASGRSQPVLAIVVPDRSEGTAASAGGQVPAAAARTGLQGVVLAAAGNTFERPGQTRARPWSQQLFAQTATNEFGLAALPVLRGDHAEQVHVAEPVRTLSAGGTHQALVTALFSKLNGGPADTAWHGVDEALGTITARDTTGVVVVPWVEQWQSDPISVTEQLATLTARLHHTLGSIEPSKEPISDEMLCSVRFRMLEPDPELRRAMAFDEDFVLLGNKGQITAGLGNAVTPPVATWLIERCLRTLRSEEVAA